VAYATIKMSLKFQIIAGAINIALGFLIIKYYNKFGKHIYLKGETLFDKNKIKGRTKQWKFWGYVVLLSGIALLILSALKINIID